MTPSGGVRPVNGERAALDILDSDDTSTFTNTGAAGINRLIAFGDLLLIDNIGRNFELRQVRNATGPAWAQRAIYDVTIFPGEDNPSILDSDVHGAFLASGDRWLLVGNHFGRVRCFRWPLSGDSMPCRPVPDVELQLPGDTERLAFDGNCFITSSPRGAYTPDPARPGLFVSEPVPPFLAEPATDVPHRLAGRWELSDWDVVTALALEAHTGMLAVAASARLALFDLDRDHDGTRLGRPRWETRLMQPARWIGFDRKGHLLVGSHEGRDDDGTGWNACTGGTLAVRTIDGSEVARASVPDEAAWGYGSDPIVLSEGGSIAYVVDRGAGLHAVDLATGVTRRLFDGVASPTKESLGIGHALRIGRHLYAGFSRGGYRVFRYEVA